VVRSASENAQCIADKICDVTAYLKLDSCLHCGVRFEKRQPFVKFCSKECRFKSIVASVKPNAAGCLLWPLAKIQATGYGQFTFRDVKTRTVTAHRTSYSIFNGPIANGMLVLHKCDERACVNPSHLFLGTQQDNIRDMLSKGRHPDMAKNLGRYAVKAC